MTWALLNDTPVVLLSMRNLVQEYMQNNNIERERERDLMSITYLPVTLLHHSISKEVCWRLNLL